MTDPFKISYSLPFLSFTLQTRPHASGCSQPGHKKPKLELQLHPADASTAALLRSSMPAAAPGSAATVQALPACRLPSVDLEAAVGELLGATEGLLADLQPADAQGTAAQLPCGLMGAVPVMVTAPAQPSTEPIETHEQHAQQELSLQPAQPASRSADGMLSTAAGPEAAPTCMPVIAAAPSAAAALSPTIPDTQPAAQPTEPHVHACAAAAAVLAIPPTKPPPTHPADAAPTAALPTAVPASAPAACGAPSAGGSRDRLVRRPAPGCSQPSATVPQVAAPCVINILKGVRPALLGFLCLATILCKRLPRVCCLHTWLAHAQPV